MLRLLVLVSLLSISATGLARHGGPDERGAAAHARGPAQGLNNEHLRGLRGIGPAKTSACDPLLESTTPGLYGMCLSYCEAGAVSELFRSGQASAANTERLAQKQEKILARYNETKKVSDPAMPCVSQNICPCWASNQTSASFWTDKSLATICTRIDQPTIRLSEIGVATANTADPEYSNLRAISMSQDAGVTFAHYCANVDTASGTGMLEQVDETTAIICATQVQSACSVLGL